VVVDSQKQARFGVQVICNFFCGKLDVISTTLLSTREHGSPRGNQLRIEIRSKWTTDLDFACIWNKLKRLLFLSPRKSLSIQGQSPILKGLQCNGDNVWEPKRPSLSPNAALEINALQHNFIEGNPFLFLVFYEQDSHPASPATPVLLTHRCTTWISADEHLY
jgi:hypothetical protein